MFPALIFSQTKLVTGTVNDENGSPLPGATIQLRGSETVGAITDFDGNFSISIPNQSSSILIISYIGYVNQEINISKY